MIRDRFTQRLILAWPQIEAPEVEEEAAEGICLRCKEEEATRTCNECVPKKTPAWAAGKFHLCFVCFSEHHATKAELRSHTFTITKLGTAKPLACCVCGDDATRRCTGTQIAQGVFDEIRSLIEGVDDESERSESDHLSIVRSSTVADTPSVEYMYINMCTLAREGVPGGDGTIVPEGKTGWQ